MSSTADVGYECIIMLSIIQFTLCITHRVTNKHDENTERTHHLHNIRAAIIGLISHRCPPLKFHMKARFTHMHSSM